MRSVACLVAQLPLVLTDEAHSLTPTRLDVCNSDAARLWALCDIVLRGLRIFCELLSFAQVVPQCAHLFAELRCRRHWNLLGAVRKETWKVVPAGVSLHLVRLRQQVAPHARLAGQVLASEGPEAVGWQGPATYLADSDNAEPQARIGLQSLHECVNKLSFLYQIGMGNTAFDQSFL